MMSTWDRFVDRLLGPAKYRYICRECARTWDLRKAENPGYRRAHYRETVRDASDGPRKVEVECGPIVYEGELVPERTRIGSTRQAPPVRRPVPVEYENRS